MLVHGLGNSRWQYVAGRGLCHLIFLLVADNSLYPLHVGVMPHSQEVQQQVDGAPPPAAAVLPPQAAAADAAPNQGTRGLSINLSIPFPLATSRARSCFDALLSCTSSRAQLRSPTDGLDIGELYNFLCGPTPYSTSRLLGGQLPPAPWQAEGLSSPDAKGVAEADPATLPPQDALKGKADAKAEESHLFRHTQESQQLVQQQHGQQPQDQQLQQQQLQEQQQQEQQQQQQSYNLQHRALGDGQPQQQELRDHQVHNYLAAVGQSDVYCQQQPQEQQHQQWQQALQDPNSPLMWLMSNTYFQHMLGQQQQYPQQRLLPHTHGSTCWPASQ